MLHGGSLRCSQANPLLIHLFLSGEPGRLYCCTEGRTKRRHHVADGLLRLRRLPVSYTHLTLPTILRV